MNEGLQDEPVCLILQMRKMKLRVRHKFSQGHKGRKCQDILIPGSLIAPTGICGKKPNFYKKGVNIINTKDTLGGSPFPPDPVPTQRESPLCTHCPPAGDWTVGLDVGGLGPGCHLDSDSRSGHLAEPVGNQGAEKSGKSKRWWFWTPQFSSLVQILQWFSL